MEKQECLQCIEYRNELNILKQKIIYLDNWKSKDTIEIMREHDYWIVIDHIKDKQSKKVHTTKHIVYDKDVDTLLNIIKSLKKEGITKIRNKQFGELLIDVKGLNMNWRTFFGSRTKYYFPIYYYPLKVLEYGFKNIRHGSINITIL